MADDKDKSPLVSISGVLLVLAAFGATFFIQPFKGERPSVPEIRESYEKINARLWQDPFRAILDSPKENTAEPKAAYEFDIYNKPKEMPCSKNNRLSDSITDRNENKIIILGVMVPGAPYADDTEMRMRIRYAVLSGLCRLNFTPDDPEHIDFIRINPTIKEDNTQKRSASVEDKPLRGKNSLANIVPYEWMTDMEDEKTSILVLWINDNVFRQQPLPLLSSLAGHIKHLKETKINDFTIIGPATSDTLKQMVREVTLVIPQKFPLVSSPTQTQEEAIIPQRIESPLFENFKKPIKIFSAMATIDNKLLIGEETDSAISAKDEIERRFGINEIDFERTIGTDEQLVANLVKELNYRNIKMQDKDTHIVLVTELDTSYGRSFAGNFLTAIEDEKEKADRMEQRKRIHVISYLRGIDGILPGEKEEKKDEKADSKSDPVRDIKKLEQPVGKSQYDYLRRLADEVYRLDQDLLYVNGEGRVKAIGVLGTDYYDKFLD
ncbi:MAG: hypothetical protein PHN75_12665, partial [Syntrophales bacterium]|nr:hypothetical protein [Syntrophales bacterium]